MSDARLGRYRLAFEMASGGMASLYLAVAESPGGFGKVLALKRIHPHLAKERDFREMFLDEARVASLLQHQNVCGVLDYGEEDGLPFFTMEYLLGESLSRVQRTQGPVVNDPGRARSHFAARVIADAAHGLHAAHELRDPEGRCVDLVHRDVSPQNLIVGYDGVTRVLDFGIARTRVQEHHTATGTIKGKFSYMAPEQLLGEDVDRRADIWALGILLWETLVGARLFKGKTEMETLLAVTQKPIADPRALNPELDPDLSAIVSRALRREIDQRYTTADEMARDLERYLVKGREPYGPTEVAARMRQLFPIGLEQKRGLMSDALAKRPGTAPEPKLTLQTPTSSLQGIEDISVVVSTSEGDAEEERPHHRMAWTFGIVALALASVVAIVFAIRPSASVVPSVQTEVRREREVVSAIEQPPAAIPRLAPPETPPEVTPQVTLPNPTPTIHTPPANTPRAPSRRRTPIARTEQAPSVQAQTPPPNAAQEADRRRPFIVETLDLSQAPPEPSEATRRPLIVDELPTDP